MKCGIFLSPVCKKQLGTRNGKNNQGRQEKNGGVKGGYRSAEELDIYTREEQTTVGRTRRWRMTDYRREQQSYVSRAGGDEGR